MEERAENTSAIDSLESALKSDFDHLRRQQQSRLKQLSSLMTSLEGCTQAVTEEGKSLDNLAGTALERLDSFKSDFGNVDNKQRELDARIEELGAALENAEREKSAMAEKLQSIESAQEELGPLREALGTKTEALDTLQREFDALRHAHDQEHQKLKNLTERAQAESSAQEELEATQADLAARNEALRTLQGEFEELRERHDLERQELRDTRERAEAAEEKLSRLENDSAAKTEDSKQLQDRIDSLESEIASRDSALENAQESLQNAQEDQNRVQAEFEALVQAQEQAEASQEGLKTELIAVQREMEALRDKYKEGLSTEAALALRQQVAETAERVKQLESELESSQRQSKKSILAQQLAEAIGETEQALEENQALKQELTLLREGQALQSPESAGVSETQSNQTELDPPEVARSPEDELKRIQKAAKNHAHGPKRVIGQILYDAGAITEDQLQQALELQKSNHHQHLGAILAELGFASEEAVAQARASQCGVEFIRITESTVDPDAASLISERLANQHSCIPLSASDREMVLAVVNPMDLLAIEDVERFTNKKVDVVVGTAPEIKHAIARYYWEPE